ncbi:unnamed protein product [Oikopleura dioica]|uniref:Kazal-like domain-containing protein n=1 Tax=Oikopleura dioica TaxID=34765 RepID=E4Z2T0_OIKDI|nr:unnamed protein product [Oikopleura dioica]
MKLLPFLISSIFCADICKNAAISTCKFVIDELCGSNGKTYLNECVFQKAACFAEDWRTRVPVKQRILDALKIDEKIEEGEGAGTCGTEACGL